MKRLLLYRPPLHCSLILSPLVALPRTPALAASPHFVLDWTLLGDDRWWNNK